eukprot:766664-Hanusia_phi.AAC.2
MERQGEEKEQEEDDDDDDEEEAKRGGGGGGGKRSRERRLKMLNILTCYKMRRLTIGNIIPSSSCRSVKI